MSSWNSLEIVKLAVAGLTPVVVIFLGFRLNRSLKRVEEGQWLNQKLIEKRISLLDKMLPALNELYCYFLCVGPWKEISPADVIARKRKLDRVIHANRPFFPAETVSAYLAFSEALFKTFHAPGSDARLRTGLTSRHGDRAKLFPGTWKAEWEELFVDEPEQAEREEVRKRYEALLDRLGADVGAGDRTGTQP